MAEIDKSAPLHSNTGFQKLILAIGIILFGVKLGAWWITNSNSIFSDAMESIVNVLAAGMGLYALHLSAKPQDTGHPYGHGKVELITSAIEGILISIAGVLIIIHAIQSLLHPTLLAQADLGMLIIGITGLINYVAGVWSIKRGKKSNSAVLISSGKHLKADTITTIGVLLSLTLVKMTHVEAIDPIIAILFGGYIIYSAISILKNAFRGIMDEADPKITQELSQIFENIRIPEWIDIHALRIQQYGTHLHLDAHVTLPYYFSLQQAHDSLEKLMVQSSEAYNGVIEFNFHMDDCKPISCAICSVPECPVRKESFKKHIPWTPKSLTYLSKHTYSAGVAVL